MAKTAMKLLLATAFILLVAIIPIKGAGITVDAKSFAPFWAQFKTAVANKNKETIAAVTKFPFTYRGSTLTKADFMYADNLIFLAEDRVITDTVAKFNWDPKVPFDQFDVRSIDNARNATENPGYRDRLLASIRDRLGTAAVKGQALDLCQELFLADGARSDEEDAVLQNLKKLLE